MTGKAGFGDERRQGGGAASCSLEKKKGNASDHIAGVWDPAGKFIFRSAKNRQQPIKPQMILAKKTSKSWVQEASCKEDKGRKREREKGPKVDIT